MSKKLLYLAGIAVTIIIGTILYLRFCCNCCTATQTFDHKTAVSRSKGNPNPFILFGPGINYHCSDNFNFLENSPSLITPISDSIGIGLENLKTVLIKNPKQKITIIGYALANEKNTTSFDNLAVARANDIKTFLISKGLPESQLDINGEIADSWKTSGDTLFGPLKFQFNELEAASTNDWNAFKEKINADPLVLYFNTNQSSDNLSKEEHQKVLTIAKYVNYVRDSKVLVTGHSDNTGDREANIALARKRADFTKNYLVKNGIKTSNIEVVSKGPDEPVSENESADGRAKNRRTVITIK